MYKVIILSKNYEKYKSGYYHDDIVSSWKKVCDVFVYGPGYPDYNSNDSFEEVMSKSGWQLGEIDFVVMSTSWDDDLSNNNVDPHEKIDLSEIIGPRKIYYLNKEYKKLELRFDYAKKNNVNLVITVHPNYKEWGAQTKMNFMQVHFGVNLDRFKYSNEQKKYDFGFTGGLHANHLDYRSLVKKEIFSPAGLEFKSNKEWRTFCRKDILKEVYNNYNIYWAEFGSRNIFGQNLLPTGKSYAKFLSKFKSFLNTPSAVGIFNTRFFELMASRTLILCPRVDSYNGILKDKINCLMFSPDLSDFKTTLDKAINDISFRDEITNKAFNQIHNHSYDTRVKQVIEAVKQLS